MRSTVDRRLPSFCMYCSNISQTVGTPAAMVTFSASISSNSEAPSSRMPGMTIFAPYMGQEKASDHEFAWNNGTTGRIDARDDRPKASAFDSDMECRTFERCEYRTPLGLPVVPDV